MTGKEVILEVEQDASLIGGVVTRLGDLVLDGSIKTQLLNMRESLKRGESVQMELKAEEISQIIKEQITDYDKKVELSETGTVF